mmetsp:Transcript_109140/g.341457  ORF Transcript_109140/g.341457 Transcript_109140/m.341457 type:complete len:204 (-) Transcript_109140:99-710(-)
MNSNLPGLWAARGVISCTPAAWMMPIRPPCQLGPFLSSSMPRASSTFIGSPLLTPDLSPPPAIPAAMRLVGDGRVSIRCCLLGTTLRRCLWSSETFFEIVSPVCRIFRSTGGLCHGPPSTSWRNCCRSSEISASLLRICRSSSAATLTSRLATTSLIMSRTSWLISPTLSKVGLRRTSGVVLLSSFRCSTISSSTCACALSVM